MDVEGEQGGERVAYGAVVSACGAPSSSSSGTTDGRRPRCHSKTSTISTSALLVDLTDVEDADVGRGLVSGRGGRGAMCVDDGGGDVSSHGRSCMPPRPHIWEQNLAGRRTRQDVWW